MVGKRKVRKEIEREGLTGGRIEGTERTRKNWMTFRDKPTK